MPDKDKPLVRVMKSHLMAWSEGILLRRDQQSLFIVNERDCVAAEEALHRDEFVWLLDDLGRVISKCTLQEVDGKKVIVESPLTKADRTFLAKALIVGRRYRSCPSS